MTSHTMRFTETKVKGAFLIDFDRRDDHRGFFSRSWCAREFEALHLTSRIAQINVCYAVRKGCIRGLHYQLAPHEEAKTVRCTRGSIFDVVLDLRTNSPTYKQWDSFELTASNHKMIYVPEGCAHGCQSLVDETELEYITTAFYAPESARGVRFDDPAFRITWPVPVDAVSEADRSWPNFEQ